MPLLSNRDHNTFNNATHTTIVTLILQIKIDDKLILHYRHITLVAKNKFTHIVDSTEVN